LRQNNVNSFLAPKRHKLRQNPIKSYKDLHSVKNACTRYTQEVYPKPPNILHLSRIWVKCKEVYPRCKEVYPRPPNILHLSRIWVKCKGVWGKSTPNEKDHFHKALPNVKNAYVTLRKFTPDLKIFYTDISAISVPLCNSDRSIDLAVQLMLSYS